MKKYKILYQIATKADHNKRLISYDGFFPSWDFDTEEEVQDFLQNNNEECVPLQVFILEGEEYFFLANAIQSLPKN